jgi:hypothetical protein
VNLANATSAHGVRRVVTADAAAGENAESAGDVLDER